MSKTITGFFFAALAAYATAAEFHIAPNGSDTNPGTADKPFATLERARDAIRTSKAAHPGEANSILLHGGEYHLKKPVVFTPADSGLPGKPLVISAAPGAQPVLTSATPITGWKPAAAATPALASEAQGKVWVADIPKGWRFHFLYADGKVMPVSRMNKSGNFHDWPKIASIGPVEPAGQLLGVAKGLLDDLPDNGDVEMNLIPVEWWNTLSVIRDFDRTASTLRRHSKSPTVCDFKDQFICNGGNYNLQNAVKFLTQPGEWAVDSAQGKVYFWPEAGSPNGLKMTAPAAYRLLEMKGDSYGKPTVHDIMVRGLHLTCTDRLPEDQWPDEWVKRQAELPDAMLFMNGVENCVIDSCIFTYSGSYAVAFQNYAQNNRVTRNEMGWLGCGGILMQGFGPGTTDVNRKNTIQRNYIHHTGNGGYMHSAAVTLYQSNTNEITLNWLDNLPYAAIQIAGCHKKEFGPGKECLIWDSYGNNEAMYKPRWDELPQGKNTEFTREALKPFLLSGNNRIANNIVTNYMTKLGDGGALYCWGCGLGNVWEDNLLRRDKTRPGEHIVVALYMDDEVDGATLRNNLCWHKGNAYDILNKGDNKWENNTIQATKPAGYDARLKALADEARKNGGWLRCPADQALIIGGDAKFLGKTTVTMTSIFGGTIRYTLNRAEPTAKSPAFTAPITIEKTTTVKAVVFDPQGKILATAEQTFEKQEVKKLAPGTPVKAADVATLEGPRFDDNKNIGWCVGGGAFAFGPYEVTQTAKAIEMTVGVDPQYAGGKVSIRLDSKNGTEIGVHQFQSTGGFEQYQPQTVTLTGELTGTHTLWFVFEGGNGICNFSSFRLLATP
jgi:hypothetical protein